MVCVPVGAPGVGRSKIGGIPPSLLGLAVGDAAASATGDLVSVVGTRLIIDGASDIDMDGSADGVFSPSGTVGNKDSAWKPKDGACDIWVGAADGTNDGDKGELRACNCDEDSQYLGGSDDSMHIEAWINDL